MSVRFSIIPVRAIEDDRLTKTDLKVLNALGAYADKNGWCNPSYLTISDRINVSKRTTIRALKRLTDYGYINKKHRASHDGGQVSNEYKILFDVELPVVTDLSLGGDNNDMGECQYGVTGGVTTACHGGSDSTVSPQYTNAPLNAPLNVASRKAETEIIKIFDDARALIFGEENRRLNASATDHVFAKRFSEAGYSSEDCKIVFIDRLSAFRQEKKQPISGLSYFEKVLPDFMAKKRKLEENPMAKKPPDYKKPLKGRSTRDPEYLKSLEDQNYDRASSLST